MYSTIGIFCFILFSPNFTFMLATEIIVVLSWEDILIKYFSFNY